MATKGKKIRERHASDRIFNAAVIILSITTFIVIAYPLWFIVIAPISNSNMVNQGKVILWPDAVIIVSTVLILCVYPFVQKYFEKGVMIGAFKG